MPLSAKLACIPAGLAPQAWPRVRDLIRRAVEKTGLADFETIEAEILAGKQLLWISHCDGAIEAAASTKIVGIGGRKVCIVVAGAGRGDWPQLMSEIERYATAEGCSTVRIYGRRGWQRVLKGFAAKYAIMERELA